LGSIFGSDVVPFDSASVIISCLPLMVIQASRLTLCFAFVSGKTALCCVVKGFSSVRGLTARAAIGLYDNAAI